MGDMQRILPQPPEKVCKILVKLGFVQSRTKWESYFFRHPDGRTTVVPFNKGEDISKGLLAKINPALTVFNLSCINPGMIQKSHQAFSGNIMEITIHRLILPSILASISLN